MSYTPGNIKEKKSTGSKFKDLRMYHGYFTAPGDAIDNAVLSHNVWCNRNGSCMYPNDHVLVEPSRYPLE